MGDREPTSPKAGKAEKNRLPGKPIQVKTYLKCCSLNSEETATKFLEVKRDFPLWRALISSVMYCNKKYRSF